MPTRKIIATTPKTDRRYRSVRLWKRDFLDIIDIVNQPELVFEIEDDRHKYSGVEDFLENAPAVITDFRLMVKSIEQRGAVQRVYVSLRLDEGAVSTSYIGDHEACMILIERLEFVFVQCQKRFGLFLLSRWSILIWLLEACSISLLGAYLAWTLKTHLDLPAWAGDVLLLLFGGITYSILERYLKTFRRCDLWVRTNRGENTWWKRNRDKMESDLVKVIVSGVIGGILGYLLPRH